MTCTRLPAHHERRLRELLADTASKEQVDDLVWWINEALRMTAAGKLRLMTVALLELGSKLLPLEKRLCDRPDQLTAHCMTRMVLLIYRLLERNLRARCIQEGA